jgi:peptidoglycan/xylan/chitin deacetylase (PgdA/CDA1 family)
MKPVRCLKVLSIFYSVIFLHSCTKTEQRGFMSQAGIALTFDDTYIDEWYQQMPLLDSFNARVTFYISSYHRISEEQKAELHTLQSHGNEIAFHSTHHKDFVKYSDEHGLQSLFNDEVDADMKLMHADGFFPVTFAYPYGSHNEVIDHFLLQQFKSVRALNGTDDYAKSLTENSNNHILYGFDIDLSSHHTLSLILDLIHSAEQGKNCLVLVGHHINRKDLQMEVPLERLRAILKTAADAHMKFYTASEISQ